jgi:signal transduction histidine kinase/ligand-binding sensor domain-containing protein
VFFVVFVVKIEYYLAMRFILAVVSCLLAVTAAQAQIYRFKVYSTSTGLPNNTVYSIFQDSKGYIWFGVEGGVCRYDGVTYTNFGVGEGLVESTVRSIFEDRNGNLWIMTRGGMSRYDGSRFTNYTTADGLADNETRSGLSTREGMLWFGTAKGLSRYDGSRFTNYGVAEGLPPGPIWALLEDRNGILWIGIRGGGLVRYDNKSFTRYGLDEGLPDENVFDIAEDNNGGLWLATSNGICYFDGSRFRSYKVADGLSSEMVSGVIVDRQNRVWCGTFGGGISRLEGNRFTVFNRSNGLPDNYFTALFEDQEGNIWCGTRWGGACRFSSELFANYTSASGIGDGLISGIAEAADGTLWFSSINNGLSTLDKRGATRRYGVKDGLLEEGLWTVFIDSHGRVWTGGLRGVSYYDGSRFQHFTLEQVGARTRIATINEDRKGRIWFGSDSSTSNGVIVYDGKNFTRYTTEQGLPHNQVNTIMIDRTGNVWLCTEAGLSRYDGESFTNYSTGDGLPDKHAICIYEDEKGLLWIGTANGLARFDGKNFQIFRTQDGLVGNTVRAITSLNGDLWIGTFRGISRFDGKQFRSYTTKDGLVSNDVSIRACLRQRDGSVWFGTTEGAVRCQPDRDTALALAPRIYLSGVRLKDQFLTGPELTLAYDQNSVTFEFLGLSFTDEDSVRYSYLLQGFDKEWSPPADSRSVRFTNLPPGKFNFIFKARSASGLWSEPKMMAIRIRPPYWQTWWFRIFGLAFIIGVAWAIYAWRIRTLENRHKRRIGSLRKLLESIRAINSQLDLTTVLQKIAAESARLVNGEPGGIGLVKENKVIFDRLWLENHWENVHLTFGMNEGIAGRVAATAKPRIVNEPKSDPDVLFPELIEKFYVHGFLDIPIIDRNGKVVGVLDVRRKQGGVLLSETDSQLLEALAHQAAVAIENADLYGALEEKNMMIVESLHEIEELYKSEQQVSRALQELNQMKTNFMIVTSHEMRTPLTILKGYHELLVDGYLGEISLNQKNSLTACQRTIDRLIQSFNDSLEMLKIEEGRVALNLTSLNLNAITEGIIEELSCFIEQRRQNIRLEAPDRPPSISADAEKLRLVLINLIQNAIKFTPDQGDIQINIASEPGGVHIIVRDSGIGIETTELERIFEKFYTSPDPSNHTSGEFQFEARGTGLGLAIAKSYVEAHGGRIWAESAGSGKGSCFHIMLPLIAQPAITIKQPGLAMQIPDSELMS